MKFLTVAMACQKVVKFVWSEFFAMEFGTFSLITTHTAMLW